MPRRGRPNKDAALVLKHVVHIRFTAAEFVRIAEDYRTAQAPSRSQYLRALCLNRHLRTRTDQNTIRALSRIGNNLNQIAKHLNSGISASGLDLESEVTALKAEVLRIADRL